VLRWNQEQGQVLKSPEDPENETPNQEIMQRLQARQQGRVTSVHRAGSDPHVRYIDVLLRRTSSASRVKVRQGILRPLAWLGAYYGYFLNLIALLP
jgi:hypothetical protein